MEVMQPFSADSCEKLENKELHIEVSKSMIEDTPCKVFVYCTKADSINTTIPKGVVIGEYTIYKCLFCNENGAFTRCLSYLTDSDKFIDFEKTPAYVSIAGKFEKYDSPKTIEQFKDINNHVLTKGPMRRIVVHEDQ